MLNRKSEELKPGEIISITKHSIFRIDFLYTHIAEINIIIIEEYKKIIRISLLDKNGTLIVESEEEISEVHQIEMEVD